MRSLRLHPNKTSQNSSVWFFNLSSFFILVIWIFWSCCSFNLSLCFIFSTLWNSNNSILCFCSLWYNITKKYRGIELINFKQEYDELTPRWMFFGFELFLKKKKKEIQYTLTLGVGKWKHAIEIRKTTTDLFLSLQMIYSDRHLINWNTTTKSRDISRPARHSKWKQTNEIVSFSFC